jgi:hypothetical protein
MAFEQGGSCGLAHMLYCSFRHEWKNQNYRKSVDELLFYSIVHLLLHSPPFLPQEILCFESSTHLILTLLDPLFHPRLGGIEEILDDGAELDDASVHMCLINVTWRLWWLCEAAILVILRIHRQTFRGLGVCTDIPDTSTSARI